MKMRKMIVVASLILVLITQMTNRAVPTGDAGEHPIDVIYKQAELINTQEWVEIPNLWVDELRKIYIDFLTNPYNAKNKKGYFNIKRSTITSWKELPYIVGSSYSPVRDLSLYKDIRYFYVAEKDDVYQESQFALNGMNYYVATLVLDNWHWKIATYGIAPTTYLIKQGFGFGTADEKSYDARRFRYIKRQPTRGERGWDAFLSEKSRVSETFGRL